MVLNRDTQKIHCRLNSHCPEDGYEILRGYVSCFKPRDVVALPFFLSHSLGNQPHPEVPDFFHPMMNGFGSGPRHHDRAFGSLFSDHLANWTASHLTPCNDDLLAFTGVYPFGKHSGGRFCDEFKLISRSRIQKHRIQGTGAHVYCQESSHRTQDLILGVLHGL